MEPPLNEFWFEGRMRTERLLGADGCMYNGLYFDIDEVQRLFYSVILVGVGGWLFGLIRPRVF